MTKKLTPIEAEKMERARLVFELRDKESALVAEKRRGLDSKQQILQLMISNLTIERRELNDELEKVQVKKTSEKKAHDEFLATVRKRLKLTDKFGYNPDTLEVMEDGK